MNYEESKAVSNFYNGGKIEDVKAGQNIIIDKTNPKRPIISSIGGGSGSGSIDLNTVKEWNSDLEVKQNDIILVLQGNTVDFYRALENSVGVIPSTSSNEVIWYEPKDAKINNITETININDIPYISIGDTVEAFKFYRVTGEEYFDDWSGRTEIVPDIIVYSMHNKEYEGFQRYYQSIDGILFLDFGPFDYSFFQNVLDKDIFFFKNLTEAQIGSSIKYQTRIMTTVDDIVYIAVNPIYEDMSLKHSYAVPGTELEPVYELITSYSDKALVVKTINANKIEIENKDETALSVSTGQALFEINGDSIVALGNFRYSTSEPIVLSDEYSIVNKGYLDILTYESYNHSNMYGVSSSGNTGVDSRTFKRLINTTVIQSGYTENTTMNIERFIRNVENSMFEIFIYDPIEVQITKEAESNVTFCNGDTIKGMGSSARITVINSHAYVTINNIIPV